MRLRQLSRMLILSSVLVVAVACVGNTDSGTNATTEIPEGYQLFEDEQFSLVIPEGWQVEEPSPPPPDFLIEPPERGDRSPRVLIDVGEPAGVEASEAFGVLFARLRFSLTDLETQEERPLDVPGAHSAIQAELTYTADVDSESFEVRELVADVVAEDVGIVVRAAATADTFEELRATYETMLSSLRIK